VQVVSAAEAGTVASPMPMAASAAAAKRFPAKDLLANCFMFSSLLMARPAPA
jgi:hypothetical protein